LTQGLIVERAVTALKAECSARRRASGDRTVPRDGGWAEDGGGREMGESNSPVHGTSKVRSKELGFTTTAMQFYCH
jgi:hypothetical protein